MPAPTVPAFSRTDPEYARYAFEKLIPEPESRRLVLELLADSIRAHQKRPECWNVTLHTNSNIALNVAGRFYSLFLVPNRVKVFFLPFSGDDTIEATNPYTTFAHVKRTQVKPDQLRDILPLLREAAVGFVREAVENPVKIMRHVQEAHAPGIIQYLNQELGLEPPLPDPAYWPLRTTAELPASELTSETEKMPNLNTILYGPPGTGKTYNTIFRAVEIVDGVRPATQEQAKDRWDELRAGGRIEFVTFHQSYGYEDFIEGIRPVMGKASDGDGARQTSVPRYTVASGVLKRLALEALGTMLEDKPQEPDATTRGLDLRTAWGKFLQNTKEESQRLPYKNRNSTVTYLVLNASPQSISGRNEKKPSKWRQTATFERVMKVWNAYAKPDSGPITGLEVEQFCDNKGAHFAFIAAVYNRLLEIAQNDSTPTPVITPVVAPVERATAFLRGGESYGQYQLIADADAPRYVLVIDEINRGNLSKTFGELITLIEDDKRVGAEWGMTVTLPFSGDMFGLPKNLYLLGTMNTADKSIALVDVALRRRFEFEEMMPDFSPPVCPGLTDEMRGALRELNRRIVLRKDRDHQIGHAFFVRVDTPEAFNRAFEKKVIPLLQEYFYADWESLRYVLGERDANGGRFIVPVEGDAGGAGSRNRWQWYRDAGQSLKCLDALAQNYRLSPTASGADAANAEAGS
jgi:hypothetical protein